MLSKMDTQKSTKLSFTQYNDFRSSLFLINGKFSIYYLRLHILLYLSVVIICFMEMCGEALSY